MPGHIMAMIDGHRWYWWRARLCDEYPDDFPKKVQWFLKDDNDWVGDFPTKREMLAWIEKDGPEWIADFHETLQNPPSGIYRTYCAECGRDLGPAPADCWWDVEIVCGECAEKLQARAIQKSERQHSAFQGGD